MASVNSRRASSRSPRASRSWPPPPRAARGARGAGGGEGGAGGAGADLLLEAVELELASLEAQGQRGVVAHRLLADAAGLLDAAELLQRPRPQEERFGVARIELQAIRQGAGGLFPLALPQVVQAEVETDVGVAGVGLEGAGKIADGGGRLPRLGSEHSEVHPYRLDRQALGQRGEDLDRARGVAGVEAAEGEVEARAQSVARLGRHLLEPRGRVGVVLFVEVESPQAEGGGAVVRVEAGGLAEVLELRLASRGQQAAHVALEGAHPQSGKARQESVQADGKGGVEPAQDLPGQAPLELEQAVEGRLLVAQARQRQLAAVQQP